MKVALTGASGFLGPVLVQRLLERGHGVHVLARDVARALGRLPSGVTGSYFKAALGEMSVAVLGGQRVLPRCALEAGYRFQHPELPEALRSLVG